MEWKDSYFEDEVREGFFVPSMVKRAWAAELEVLSQVDRICRKYNIPYFADWGTLLGTVRHGGFIPWDDDIDISMKREDYNRFMEAAGHELPEGYDVYNYRENKDYWGFVTRVVAKRRICFEEEHLKKFHGFPYIVGIDIFILDYVSPDEEKENERAAICNYILMVADKMAEGSLSGVKAEEGLKRIENICGVHIDRAMQMNELRVFLYDLVVKYFGMFSEEESDELTRMMPDGLNKNKALRLPKGYYSNALWLPYENTKMPVPMAYDEMLTRRYGDYMKLVKNAGGHDYPFFESQKKQLQRVLDFDIPHYTFSEEAFKRRGVCKENTLKGIAAEYKSNSIRIIKEIEDNICKSCINEAQELIVEGQQYAIEFAELVEQAKKEENITVAYLEEYCEVIYQLYRALSDEKACVTGEKLKNLKLAADKVNESIDRLLKRREIVFIPYKAVYWNAMKSVYEEAVNDLQCDVYVIPAPYFYKEYDGRLFNMQYDGEKFPTGVHITKYDDYDFSLHNPEVIVIQNPYDQWNLATSVPEFFYSSNLKNYTDKLVYIPYFKVNEFCLDNFREYSNMQYYCTMPGVVNSDMVIVQSENMRQLYIEKLVEFAGEDTRDIWEKKIKGTGTPIDDGKSLENVENLVPEDWKQVIFKGGTKKRIVLFHVEISSFIQYQEGAIEKIKSVLTTFREHSDHVALIWIMDETFYDNSAFIEEAVLYEFEKIIGVYRQQGWGIYDSSGAEKLCVDLCDGYYGDAGRLAHACRSQGKPVMICNYAV
ncbi:MAG: LicD family protein [Eubacteriales bacterium]|nr:LicD family protein [Eubacteriales bacterium]